MTARRTIAFALVAVLAVGCADDHSASSPADPAATNGATGTLAPAGWIGGEPDFDASSGGESASKEAGGSDERLATAVAPSATYAGAATTMASASDGIVGPDRQSTGSPKAGSVDDNDDFEGFADYLERIAQLGIAVRPIDVRGRIAVSVTDESSRVASHVPVEIRDGAGDLVATMWTTADGTVRFHPGARTGPFTFASSGATVSAPAGGTARLTVSQVAPVPDRVPLDILFLLDATGSMSDEIDRLTATLDDVVARVASLGDSPDLRLAMTVYRDIGDTFVTRTFQFTDDVTAFRAALADVRADGGGDTPEALDEALDEALSAPQWRPMGEATQLVFLVADAAPHVDRQVSRPYDESVRDAAARGIKVFPIASSNSDDQAEAVFRQIAQQTGARFVFLSYGSQGAALGTSTDIDSTDYEELPLDDLIVRLTAEELSARLGRPVEATESTATTTRPDGQ